MGCGCYGKMIKNASTNEHFEKAKKFAKCMARDTGAWYVVVCKNDGTYNFMPEISYRGYYDGEIVVRLSPM